ncbi:glycoside hydrolase family 27 protein [Mycena pura]|uniref:alpha-galactosidase n=1 Tax=Mycena pura TaxID=153505 RepID=A0AAD6Y2T7_9AGAR|nr:glycoside hydrolase family 27 protein [Mycena pura]
MGKKNAPVSTSNSRSAAASPGRLALLLTSAVSIALGVVLASVSTTYYTTHRSAAVTRVGRLPVMGYNTWNAYHVRTFFSFDSNLNEHQCGINETVILETASLIKSLGLADVGYNHVNIDDCYSEKQRNANGDIVEDKERFPSGMRWLTDHIHSLGLDAGWFTCALYPGSFQNEERDVKLFREEWGFDLLKYDNCAVPFDEITRENIIGRYTRMANAIAAQAKASGKPPLLLSLCEWGNEQPWLWARRLGQSWRTTGDIAPKWASVASIINQNSFISWASDFYGHGDMDMVCVARTSVFHLKLTLADASPETLEILKNTEIIAINQDPVVGTALTPFRWGLNPNWTPDARFPAQYWSGESENGTVIMMLNTRDEPAHMFFSLTESPWLRAGRQYFVRDLWSHTDNGTAVRNISVRNVPPHGVVALLLRDAGDEPAGLEPRCAVHEWCMDKNGTMV